MFHFCQIFICFYGIPFLLTYFQGDVLVVARYPVSPSECARYIYLIMSIAFIIRFLNK
jgi:hypothetical protein